MEWIICPAEGCGKKIKSLKSHYRSSHPDLDVPDLRNLGPASEPEKSQAQVGPLPQKSSIEKLKAFGINPNDIMVVFRPLVENAVVQTLEKMQLGEFLNKKVDNIEKKLAPLVDLAERIQADSQPSGDGQVQPQGNTSIQERALSLLERFANKSKSDSGGGLETLLKQQGQIGQLVEAFTKPYRDAEEATLKRVNVMLGIGSKAGMTPKEVMEKLEGAE